jgi:protein TonB
MASRLLGPSRIPPGVSRLTETVPPPPVLDLSGLAINHGIGDARGHGTVRDAIMGSGLGILPPALPAVHPLRISRMMEAHLIHRVEPRYPLLALQARRQGQVILRALISRAGMIEHLQLVSGHPLLAQAAIEAVSQWRYRPYVLNGEAVEVETQVTVNFYLSKD